MLLVLDNYDSFTYNLVQYFAELGQEVEVYRNDAISLEQIAYRQPTHLCISPGPCTPNEAGISLEVIEHFAPKLPILGVCLGHQALAQVYGAQVVRAQRLMHGKTSEIAHNNEGVFAGLSQPFTATRYHSLTVAPESLPACLKVSAHVVDHEEEIMGLTHRDYPLHGVQFHPESILTKQGKQLLRNFLEL